MVICKLELHETATGAAWDGYESVGVREKLEKGSHVPAHAWEKKKATPMHVGMQQREKNTAWRGDEACCQEGAVLATS